MDYGAVRFWLKGLPSFLNYFLYFFLARPPLSYSIFFQKLSYRGLPASRLRRLCYSFVCNGQYFFETLTSKLHQCIRIKTFKICSFKEVNVFSKKPMREKSLKSSMKPTCCPLASKLILSHFNVLRGYIHCCMSLFFVHEA